MIEALAALAIGTAIGEPSTCSVSRGELDQNVMLTYEQFDQVGALPSSFRSLSNRKCYREAAAVTADYLERREGLTDREVKNLTFHMAQAMAMSGAELEASLIIPLAKTRSQPTTMNWNAYLTGTYAFLTKEHTLLQSSYDELARSERPADRVNSSVLEGFLHCFNKPYVDAYSQECRANPTTPNHEKH